MSQIAIDFRRGEVLEAGNDNRYVVAEFSRCHESDIFVYPLRSAVEADGWSPSHIRVAGEPAYVADFSQLTVLPKSRVARRLPCHVAGNEYAVQLGLASPGERTER